MEVTTDLLLGVKVAVDLPKVTHVIHINYLYDIVSYAQEAGGAGRKHILMLGNTVFLVTYMQNCVLW